MGLPNMLTILRLILIPFFAYFVFFGYNTVALCLFGMAALTDWLDGYVARSSSSVTSFGKHMDPLADRLLIMTALIILAIKNQLPLFVVMIITARDLFVMIGFQYMRLRYKEISVTYLGKTATAILMVSIILLIAGVSFGLWLFYLGFLLYLISFGDYVRKAFFILKCEGGMIF
ncbi:MAG TPA: CDP-diacylglycerol--glycerol-3-phosphate 3-phosphatidyltransferase [Actinobacteria bacterium]|nr:CDP-diacylglycerol--glycerol-3-phosphate 3-phosphatidyltransferase [Actinomycetota bacterium]